MIIKAKKYLQKVTNLAIFLYFKMTIKISFL